MKNSYGYDGAAHIFNWGRNDQALCKKMRYVRTPGEFITERGQAQAALNLAWEITRAGCNDISVKLLEPSDLLRAALLFLEWDGES